MKEKLIKWLGGYTAQELENARTTRKLKEQISNLESKTKLAREQAGSVDLDSKWIDDMEQRERRNILSEAHDIYNKDSLGTIINELAKRQIMYVAQEAQNFDTMNFGRGTLNGITLLQEELENLNAIYKAENQQQETFDPYKVVSEE